ncbi:hypothetical protein I4U23_013018 [Adineta vaga]|nr:hypothetical protein I4U23_013018 [Adineta vaga]
MTSITLICLYLATLLPLTIQHQCVGSCSIYLTFNETFNTLPSECAQTIQNNECYTEISFDYVSKLINIKLGEQSLVGDNATLDNYYISHETEMWHETFNVQWTTFIHKCFYGDLCDFEYVKMKVVEMRKLTWNFEQFQQKLSSALFTSDSGTDAIRCMSTDSQSITCANDIKTCILDADNIYTNKTRRSCSSHSDDQS